MDRQNKRLSNLSGLKNPAGKKKKEEEANTSHGTIKMVREKKGEPGKGKGGNNSLIVERPQRKLRTRRGT